ncbi:ORC1-type DNA replication protein [Halolamina pelagica]|uniref:ORC1-type DNA replication protein n=1 Tax=Halolamina pelagica TaxID=699431 RepID=A0A0P7H8G8_9EURY|nr:ORC1-type DNA replication protein [Halolamina pelagica]
MNDTDDTGPAEEADDPNDSWPIADDRERTEERDDERDDEDVPADTVAGEARDSDPDPDATDDHASTDSAAESDSEHDDDPAAGGVTADDTADDSETDDGGADPASVLDTGGEPVTDDSVDSVGTSVDLDTGGVDIDRMLEDDGDSQGLFDDLMAGEPIFSNKEVLRPSYTPHELPHRTDQINQMATILVSALRGDTPSNILIYGKTGTGKTASAKFVSQELESTSQKYDVPCEVEYINCEITDTQYRVLAQLANKFIEKNREIVTDRLEELRELRSAATDGDDALADTEFESIEAVDETIAELEADRDEMEEVPMTGWPTDRVYTKFFDAIDYHERVVVIMLDEIDKLVEKSGDDTLYNLSRMNSELETSRISIMGISNDLKFTDFLDPRVKSSLGEEEIVFPPTTPISSGTSSSTDLTWRSKTTR